MSQRTRVLGGRYAIEERVGRGGMAEVYRATDLVLGRTVAVKVLSDRFAGDRRFVTRFRREAQAAAGLNHPNVVSVFDTGSDDGQHYIVMEYVEGPTLADVLARQKRLPPGRAARIGGAVAAALAAAHDRGLVHRDVKPGNIMLTGRDHVKVMDFGIARAAADDTLTQTGTILGTAAYLSPEQAQGHPVEPPSDVYSLGCVLYELLTGSPPFTGDSPVSVAFKHVRDDPVPISRMDTGAPPELEAVVMRALAKEPGQRYASGRELQQALVAAVGGAAVPTDPLPGVEGDTAVLPELPEHPPPPRERRWLVPAILGVVLLALVVAGLVALANQSPEPRAQDQGPSPQAQRTEEAPEEPAPPSFGEPGSIEEAVNDLQTLLNAGLGAGAITEKAAADLEKRIEDSLRRYAEGDLRGALQRIADAHARVDGFLEEGEITGDAWADALHQGLEALVTTMRATPPPDEDDDGRGRGNGNRGKGEGKGNDDD
ncbi:MAG: protein kinase domain-containing protein [Actinomycetota bacterium]